MAEADAERGGGHWGLIPGALRRKKKKKKKKKKKRKKGRKSGEKRKRKSYIGPGPSPPLGRSSLSIILVKIK